MKLPAITDRQDKIEAAREFHESIYCAFRADGGRVLVPVLNGDREQRQHQISGCLKDFWRRRGFRLRTHQTVQGIECWLEITAHPEGR